MQSFGASVGLDTNETSARIPGMALSVSTTKAASRTPRSRSPEFCADSVPYNERCTLAARRRDCSMRSCRSAEESVGATALVSDPATEFALLKAPPYAAIPLGPRSFEPGAEKKLV